MPYGPAGCRSIGAAPIAPLAQPGRNVLQNPAKKRARNHVRHGRGHTRRGPADRQSNLIGSLDDKGCLSARVEGIAFALEADFDHVRAVLARQHVADFNQLEPSAGVDSASEAPVVPGAPEAHAAAAPRSTNGR
jgi:hypothetical protein